MSKLDLPGSDREEIQGRALVNASIANGVTRLATVAGLSIPPTTLLRWEILSRSTMYVEKHLEKEAAASAHGMTCIILRPVTFF